MCVDMSQEVTVWTGENAMNCLYFGRAMHEKLLASGTGHSVIFEPLDASHSLSFLSDTTKRWSLD